MRRTTDRIFQSCVKLVSQSLAPFLRVEWATLTLGGEGEYENSFRTRKDCKKKQNNNNTNISVHRAINLFGQCPRYLCYNFLHNWTQCIDGVSLFLQTYVRNDNGVKNPAILIFFLCHQKNPVKCRACVEKCDWMKNGFLGNTPISPEPLIRISRHLYGKP